ncbi:MAG: outer membrane beta-barrel protein, partial [Bacteroidales bacterium]|nr:outer membrane beta-barrel protein [Bacteroidales bacterium]
KYKAGAGGSVGVGYDFYFLPYMGIGSGVEFSFLRSSYRVEERNYSMSAQFDDDPMHGGSGGVGAPFTFLVQMRNEQTEQRATYLNIPLMLRFRVKWFSFGAGVKAGFPLSGTYNRFMGELKTEGKYGMLAAETLENMPNHGFVDEKATYGNGKLSLRTDWAVSVDFGITLRPEGSGKGKGGRVPFLEAGIFADYGLRNINKGGAEPVYPITYDASVSGCLRQNSGLVTASGTPLSLHSLSVGVRIAVGLSWR